MQQMAGHMNLLSPFVFNQFGPYGAYAQQQQAALMAAATAQGTYINPMAALATQIPHALNGEFSHIFYWIFHLFSTKKIKKRFRTAC